MMNTYPNRSYSGTVFYTDGSTQTVVDVQAIHAGAAFDFIRLHLVNKSKVVDKIQLNG
jgi:hypothetical protein